MTRSGLAYELQTLALLTDETDGSASRYLLPSPQAQESTPTQEYVEEVREHLEDPHKRLYLPGRKAHSQRTLSRVAPVLLPTPGANDSTGAESETRDARRAEGRTGGPSLRDLPKLLPTPDTGESLTGHGRRGGRPGNGSQSGRSLETTVELLPTPAARDGKGPNPNHRDGGPDLPTVVTLLVHPLVTTLLPTPKAADGENSSEQGPRHYAGKGDNPTLLGAARRATGQGRGHGKLLPTPLAGDGEGGRTSKGSARPDEAGLAGTVKLLPTPVSNEENPGAGGELRAALVHGEGRRSTSETDTMGRPIRKGRDPEAPLLPTPRAVTSRSSRRAMVENRQWSAPSLEQAVEIAEGTLPREFETWEEVPGWSGERMSPQSGDGSPPSDEPLPGQLTISDGSTPDSPSGCSATPTDG